MLPPRNISRESDDEWNSRVLLETIDTDRCIQKLVRTELEGSECPQRKIEKTIQYWVVQEKEAAMNYHRTLELNNSVSNKRVQQLYSQDQSQEMIFYCYILYLLFDVRILNVALYVSRCGMYACVHRWVTCICPRGVWLSTGIDVRLWRASKMYMTVLVSIPRRYMHIDDVRF